MLKENHMEITKTVRYYTLGSLDEHTKEIIFVIHGYGELASEFIMKFDPVMNKHRFIIAPEAPNKFYLRGVKGKIGSSWMTSEDRANEIRTNLNYFDKLYAELLTGRITPAMKIRLLGFSQGGATACRWFANTIGRIDELILWGGVVPPDIDANALKEKLQNPLIVIAGDDDRFITKERLAEQTEFMNANKINYSLKKYSGKHDILPEYFNQISFF